MGNIHVKLYVIRTSGSGEDKVYGRTDDGSGELKSVDPDQMASS